MMLQYAGKVFSLTAADLTTVRLGPPLILLSGCWDEYIGLNAPMIFSVPFLTMTSALDLGPQILTLSQAASWGGAEKSVALHMQTG